MSFTQVIVTGQYENEIPAGPAPQGMVSFTLSAEMVDSSTGEIVPEITRTATLDSTGSFSITLWATDDSTTLPTGVTYEVVEDIHGATNRPAFNVSVPHADAPTVALAALPGAT